MVAVASALTFGAGRAGACSFPGFEPHVTDDSRADDVPPEPPQDVSVIVFRGHAPESAGCGEVQGSSCDGIGRVALTLNEPATDDQTSAEQMGYLIELSSGELPGGLVLPETAVRARAGALELIFQDDTTEGQEVVAFSLTLTPVDEANNLGPASDPIRVYDSGSAEGCRVASSAASLDAALLLGLIAVARRLARR